MAGFTKQVIQNTVLQLLQTTPLDKLTVKQIVDSCGISRNTFYYHYEDMADLLQELVTEEVRKAFRQASQSEQSRKTCCLLGALSQQLHLFRCIRKSEYRTLFQVRLRGAVEALLREELAACGGGELPPYIQQDLLHFFSGGLLFLCLQWLDQDQQDTVEHYQQRLQRLDALLPVAVQRARDSEL